MSRKGMFLNVLRCISSDYILKLFYMTMHCFQLTDRFMLS